MTRLQATPMAITYLDRFDNGTWIKVPSADIDGTTTVVTGRWLKRAAIDAEECAESELAQPQLYIEKLKEYRSRGLLADIFTFAQKLPHTERKYPYPMEAERVAAIRMTAFSDWWDNLPQVGRKNVRRATKRGVEICLKAVDDDLVRGIIEINDETPIRQGKQFTHYGESFDRVKTDFLAFSDRSDVLCAYVGNELIGLAKIIYCGDVAAVMKLQTKISHADKRPANALIARAIERCYEKRASYVTYGLYRYGNQAWTSLMEFKARHGFEEIVVPRYYVPLSLKGALSSRLKLYRGVVGILPPRVVQVGRTVRARWTAGLMAGVAQR
jgi:hypothetical protein